jgi:hypothetical protein
MASRSSELNGVRPTKRRESQLSLQPIAAASWYRLPNCEIAQSRLGKFKLPPYATTINRAETSLEPLFWLIQWLETRENGTEMASFLG